MMNQRATVGGEVLWVLWEEIIRGFKRSRAILSRQEESATAGTFHHDERLPNAKDSHAFAVRSVHEPASTLSESGSFRVGI